MVMVVVGCPRLFSWRAVREASRMDPETDLRPPPCLVVGVKAVPGPGPLLIVKLRILRFPSRLYFSICRVGFVVIPKILGEDLLFSAGAGVLGWEW